ncbi:MAG: TerC family protein [Cytophagales bacterium]|jgi:tellurite resistance protein TerC|nr:TerC family protein [Cytophagales bacterium]MCA6378713.1 TerC family protein [Cytophagales bacterium]MCA6387756.1 TerC family protein [Cytophagales bacterium]MCA6390583.1 TerC family protein [Cytophagales bacterium]MCA6396312.1 TerC family protein [Cytophagales bacterium]
MSDLSLLWIAFNLFVLAMLALDLGVFHRKSHEVSIREALTWTCVWITLAMLFNLFVYYYFDRSKALEFFTGYIIEKSLSVDNIFVIILIFSYFKVPSAYQHKVLFWGILGALVMRVIFILTGVELIHRFHWLIYIFGGFLVYTGIRMLTSGDLKIDPEKNPLVKLARRIMPITPSFEGDRFFVKQEGKTWATPLFLVVILIETTDLIFAVDSIPAILAISDDSFIVYTSNVFAILGLRSLYFALAGIEKYFKYLKYGLSAILVFVGVKMCVADLFKIPIEVSLIVIGFTLMIAMVSSRLFPGKQVDKNYVE